MIIVFLKYTSTRNHEPTKTKEKEKPAVAKETVKETQVVHDAGVRNDAPAISEAHGESLG